MTEGTDVHTELAMLRYGACWWWIVTVGVITSRIFPVRVVITPQMTERRLQSAVIVVFSRVVCRRRRLHNLFSSYIGVVFAVSVDDVLQHAVHCLTHRRRPRRPTVNTSHHRLLSSQLSNKDHNPNPNPTTRCSFSHTPTTSAAAHCQLVHVWNSRQTIYRHPPLRQLSDEDNNPMFDVVVSIISSVRAVPTFLIEIHVKQSTVICYQASS